MSDYTSRLEGVEEIRRLLTTITIDGKGGLEAYANEDCERFLRTLDLIPKGVSSVLEIGANPYFLPILAKWYRPELHFVHTNYFGPNVKSLSQTVSIETPDGKRDIYEFDFINCNVEEDNLPGDFYDCVVFCEVLEHMTNDPLHPLKEINRVLKEDGILVMTTPNVARLENVALLMGGHNIYDPYSAYGPYGRHNREYNKHELNAMLHACGFSPEILETFDVHENRALDYFPKMDEIIPILDFRHGDLGQYHFTRSIKSGKPREVRPQWLYRSY